MGSHRLAPHHRRNDRLTDQPTDRPTEDHSHVPSRMYLVRRSLLLFHQLLNDFQKHAQREPSKAFGAEVPRVGLLRGSTPPTREPPAPPESYRFLHGSRRGKLPLARPSAPGCERSSPCACSRLRRRGSARWICRKRWRRSKGGSQSENDAGRAVVSKPKVSPRRR